MHYVDEGRGEPVIFLHGNPTWSYIYRGFVRPLSSNYRIIAPDHLGFGRSENLPKRPTPLSGIKRTLRK